MLRWWLSLVPGALVVAGWLGSPSAAAVGDKTQVDVKDRSGKSLGSITLLETTAGTLLKVKIGGLPRGPHGFQIHEMGKCEGDFISAGAIYNPLGAKHGYLSEEGPMVGDLPNLIAGANGEVEAELLSPFVTLSKDAEESLFDADGSAILIYERADDYLTDPDGNAGAPIACGVIAPGR